MSEQNGLKVLVLGGGQMGAAAAKYLVDDDEFSKVVVNDRDKERLDDLKNEVGNEKLTVKSVDATDEKMMLDFMKQFDVGVMALPSKLATKALEMCMKADLPLSDLTMSGEAWEDRISEGEKYHKKLIDKDIAYVPCCGLAPGITNVMVKHGANQLDHVDKAHVKVGGLPKNPQPPLDYKITFVDVENMFRAYTGKSRLVRNGKLVEREAISEVD